MTTTVVPKTDYTLFNSSNFNGIKCDFYKNDKQEYFFTREQIGRALGYANPSKAIEKNHSRHHNRLDKYSTTPKVGKSEGGRCVSREIVLYSEIGVYEICRWSQKSKADEFIDWVWQIINTYRNEPRELLSTKSDAGLMTELHNLQNKFNEYNNKLCRIESLIFTLIPPVAPNLWKDGIIKKIKEISSVLGYSDDMLKPIYADIYKKMFDNYGLDVNTYKANYLREHKDVRNISAINVVASYDELKEAFEEIVDNYTTY